MVEYVDRNLLSTPLGRGGRHLQGGQGHQFGTPDRAEVRGGGRGRSQANRGEHAADRTPASPVTHVRQLAEALLSRITGERDRRIRAGTYPGRAGPSSNVAEPRPDCATSRTDERVRGTPGM